jgi:hypothetical protein
MATIAKAAKPPKLPKAYYEILVTLTRDNDVVPHVPKPLRVGKTVHYRGRGEVKIDFGNRSPYQQKKVTSNEVLKLKNPGHFIGRCTITKDGVTYGWLTGNTSGNRYAGANHDVQ